MEIELRNVLVWAVNILESFYKPDSTATPIDFTIATAIMDAYKSTDLDNTKYCKWCGNELEAWNYVGMCCDGCRELYSHIERNTNLAEKMLKEVKR